MSSQEGQNQYQITLLRHGESVGNASGYYQGHANFPLTERGEQQIHALADRWLAEGTNFDLVISSTLSRARQTAEIIARRLNVPLELDPLWMERDAGKYSGLRPEDAFQVFPPPEFIHPYLPFGETGESRWELYLRGGRVIQALMQRPPGRYLIVSHGGILNMVMYAILGIAPQANSQGPHFRFKNSAFAILTYHPGQHLWRVEALNDHAHWIFDDAK
jgi:2,3-bisphosphoglycerate-dependent phosphoglycerate mutase